MRRLVFSLVLIVLLALPVAAAAKPTVYFTRSGHTPGLSQIWSVPADGGESRLVRRQMPNGPEGGIATLSRDGRRLLCICRKDEVSSVRTDGTRLRRVGALPRAVRYDVVTLGSDGRAFWVKGFTKVFSLAPGARKPRVFRAVSNRESVVDERVVPSPDGRRIAFVVYGCLVPACGDDDLETLLTAKPDGSDRTVVYQSSGEGKEIREVAWSADDRYLVFADGTGEGDPKGELPVFYPTQYLVAPADGGDSAGHSLTLPGEGFSPYFSPNTVLSPDAGIFVYTSWEKPTFALSIAPVEIGEKARVTKTNCRYPACEFPPRVFAWR